MEDIRKWRQIGIDALAKNCSIKISNIFNVYLMENEFNDKLKNEDDCQKYNPMAVFFAIYQMPDNSSNIGQFLLNLKNFINNNYKTKTMESSKFLPPYNNDDKTKTMECSRNPPPYRSVNSLYPSLETTDHLSVEPSAPEMVV